MYRPVAAALILLGAAQAPEGPRPVVATEPVAVDADDPAIWVHPADPSKSLILGTDKAKPPNGGLYAFSLEGKIRQRVGDLDRPNNVDVERGLALGGRSVDIAVVTERGKGRLRVYEIQADTGTLVDRSSATGLAVFADAKGDEAAPMGVSLYKRPRDAAIFAVVGRKAGPREGYLAEYRLLDDGEGRVKATEVRRLGRFSGTGEIEAIAVDDELGYVYYADENAGIRKYHADPDHPEASRELAFFATEGIKGDREGIAILAGPDGMGLILCVEQIKGGSRVHLYKREGEPGRPHDHSRRLATVPLGTDDTDGLEASSVPMGPRFPRGVVAAMNSRGRNFWLFDAGAVEAPAAR